LFDIFAIMLDPIERISQRVVRHCSDSLELFLDIDGILDSSDTIAAAFDVLRAKGYDRHVDADNLDLVQLEIGCLRRCIDSMSEIRRMARKVFVVNFFESDLFYVFNQEVSFSYACKMISAVGPKLAHFSNHPTSKEVIDAELRLACSTPFLALDGLESDLLCLESMPAKSLHPNSATTSI
jgi:hypothetical protein